MYHQGCTFSSPVTDTSHINIITVPVSSTSAHLRQQCTQTLRHLNTLSPIRIVTQPQSLSPVPTPDPRSAEKGVLLTECAPLRSLPDRHCAEWDLDFAHHWQLAGQLWHAEQSPPVHMCEARHFCWRKVKVRTCPALDHCWRPLVDHRSDLPRECRRACGSRKQRSTYSITHSITQTPQVLHQGLVSSSIRLETQAGGKHACGKVQRGHRKTLKADRHSMSVPAHGHTANQPINQNARSCITLTQVIDRQPEGGRGHCTFETSLEGTA